MQRHPCGMIPYANKQIGTIIYIMARNRVDFGCGVRYNDDVGGGEPLVKGVRDMAKRRWERRYKGWVITHDPYGMLACYREEGPELRWCYFGCSVDVIKMEIDRREFLADEPVGVEG